MLFQRKRDVASAVDLPITPMLDMAFQLLTFFVFTYIGQFGGTLRYA